MVETSQDLMLLLDERYLPNFSLSMSIASILGLLGSSCADALGGNWVRQGGCCVVVVLVFCVGSGDRGYGGCVLGSDVVTGGVTGLFDKGFGRFTLGGHVVNIVLFCEILNSDDRLKYCLVICDIVIVKVLQKWFC